MSRSRRSSPRDDQPALLPEGVPWLALGLLAVLALTLFARCFTIRFVGDDYILLDAAKRLPFLELLSGRAGIPGFYRPVSRELYFWLWGRVLDLSPAGYHAVNAATWAASGALFFVFLRRWLGARVAWFALAALVLFPPGGALLSWISCAQDLIALFWCAAALVLYQRGRHVAAGIAVAFAALSKETALPFALALAAFEWAATPGAPPRERLARLRPAFAGLTASLVVAVLVRALWPAGRAIAVWSPGEIVNAWRLPAALASTFAPPHTLPGIAAAWREAPLGLALPALLALVVPCVAPQPAAAREAHPPARAAMWFALAVTVLGALPVAVIVERWRGYYFSIAALGTSLLLGLLLSRMRPWLAAPLLAAAALVSYGSNSIYRPLPNAQGAGRHAHANYVFFRDAAAITGQLLATLEPYCDSLRTVRRAVVLGLPPGVLYDTVIGAGQRVACRDTAARVLRIEHLSAADAAAPLALLTFDPSLPAFEFRRAGAAERVTLGDSLLARGRTIEALACYAAARSLRDTSVALRRRLGPALGSRTPVR